jgi:methyl-accepting chemotaxis protein
MDGTTQQNAALVEQAAAASQSMQDTAAQLSAAVAVFKLDQRAAPVAAAAAAPVASRPALPAARLAPAKPARTARPAKAAPVASDWEEF